DFCQAQNVGALFIGNPHGVRQQDKGRHHNQRMAGWEYGRDIAYLAYKAKAASIESFDFRLREERVESRQHAAGNRKYVGAPRSAVIKNARFEATETSWAVSTCTHWPLAPGSPSPLTSRINEPAPCGSWRGVNNRARCRAARPL